MQYLARTLLGSVLLLAAACSSKEAKAPLGPVLGTLDLPIAQRVGGSAPSDATRVELGISELRIDGETALVLDRGRVPAAEVRDHVLVKLQGKLGKKPVVALSTHAAVPYATLALVAHTALTAGAKEFAFKVRKPGSNTETGWLITKRNRFTPTPEQPAFTPDELPAWDSFTKIWEDAVDACQVAQRGDCGYKPVLKAAGGKLELMLRVRGGGLALRFRQVGAPAGTQAAPKAKPVEMVEGVKAPPPKAEEPPPEPSTEHIFTLRAEHATATPSPISGIMQVACGSQACPALVDAEAATMSGLVLSLVGAAFPDGSPEPNLAWALPNT